MEWHKTKSALICFFIAVDLLFGLILYSRVNTEKRLAAESVSNAVSALASMGITAPETIFENEHAPIGTLILMRDSAFETAAFLNLLGGGQTSEQGSGIVVLTGARGTASLMNMGSFELSLTGAAAEYADAGDVFAAMGAAADGDMTYYEYTENGYYIHGTQRIDGITVFNMEYTMYFENGLLSFEGSRLFGQAETADEQLSKSLAAALLVYGRLMEEAKTPCTVIYGAELGYAAEVSSPGYTKLIPVWSVDSDAGAGYINALTLELYTYFK